MSGTRIAFTTVQAGRVQLDRFDVTGRHLRSLVDGELAAGSQSVAWDGRDDSGARLSPGIYLYRLTTGGVSQSRKLLLIGK